MKTISQDGGFEDVIQPFSPTVQAMARRLRDLIAEVQPEAIEVPWSKQGSAGYGLGPKKMSEHYCYIAPQKQYVTLGFFHGAALSDPAGLLEGTGKALRHVKIYSEADVARPALKQLLEAALAERKAALNLT